MRPSAASVNLATAALIPSSDVPDIKPTTTPDDTLLLPDRWWFVLRHAPDDATVLRQKPLGVLPADSTLLHHDGELDALSSGFQQSRRFLAGHTADFHHDALAAIDQLVVGSAEIDHQIAVGLAEPDHRAGGDGVEYELGGSAGLHPGRSRHDFGADDGQHRHVDTRDEVRRRGRAGDDPGAGAERGSSLERGANVRSGSRGSDSDHEILFIDFVLVDDERSILDDVFGPFLGARQRRQAAGDDSL